MLNRKRTISALAATAIIGGMAAFTAPANAAVIATMTQVGANVVVSASGTLDISSLTPDLNISAVSQIYPAHPTLFFGSLTRQNVPAYILPSYPPAFGTGTVTVSSTTTGNSFGIIGGDLVVPSGYISGTSLSGKMTFGGTTIAALGATPGTYTTNWGSGAKADRFTLTVGPVPEPSSIALLATGIGVLGLGMQVTRRKAL